MYDSEFYLPPVRRATKDNDDRSAIVESIILSDMNRVETSKKYQKFKTDTKSFFLREAMYKLLKESLPDSIDESYLNTGKILISNFINEEGVENLLNNFESTSLFLSEMASIVTKSYNSVIEGCDITDPSGYLIKQSDVTKFYDNLNTMDNDKMRDAIVNKVASAELEFINSNAADRENIERVAQETKDKMDSFRAKDAEVTEAVRENYQMQYRAEVNKIHRRSKGLLESMVFKASNSIVSDENLRGLYLNESGGLDSRKIINTCEVMYTFLEMVNTARIRTVDEKYIKEVISSIC